MDLKYRFTFHKRLFMYLMSLFGVFLFCFLAFQYQREKSYKIESLNYQMQLYNTQLAAFSSQPDEIQKYISSHSIDGDKNIRVTIIDMTGNVIYDSSPNKILSTYKNHSDRPEIIQAIKRGSGYTICRLSQSTSEEYFYSATKVNDLIIRTAMPYDVSLIELLSVDKYFLWFMFVLALLIAVAVYLFTGKLGRSIARLKFFAQQADKGQKIDDALPFPNDELGEISTHIVRLYAKLRQAKDALQNEHQMVLHQEQEQIRLKKQLTQNINHELKTPVSSIHGYLETIMRNPDMDEDKKQKFIENSYSQVNRLSKLLNDISTITRMDEVSAMIEKEDIVINAIIDEALEDMSGLLEQKNIKVNVSIPQRITIKGNAGLLHSIFRNLLDNAIAYSGCININIRLEECTATQCVFSFSDDGVGVEQVHLPHLFERFYRVDKGRSRKMGGTGLGLSIVKNAVILHGGSIIAKNGEKGGLTFIFSFSLIS